MLELLTLNSMKNWLLNWTSFVTRNTQVEFDGISYEDGPEWFQKMWESWLKNSDYGQKLSKKIKKKKHV
jgi:hypothetical protein